MKSGSYGFRFNVSGHLSFCRFFVAFVVVKPALVEKRRCFSQKVGWKNLMSLFAHFFKSMLYFSDCITIISLLDIVCLRFTQIVNGMIYPFEQVIELI